MRDPHLEQQSEMLNSSDLFRGMRTIIGALGIAGSLSLIGYIAAVAHQDMLGTGLNSASITELGFAAGQFLLDSLLVLLERSVAHWIWTVILVILIASIWFLRHTSTRKGERWHRVSESALVVRSEEHTSELQSLRHLVCRLLL